MRVLVGCEESQEITKAFRALGHEAYSCDLKPCSGGRPEWHIRDDLRHVLSHAHDRTQSGQIVYHITWDILVVHPDCTDLAVSGARHFAKKRADGTQRRAIEFFLMCWNAPVERIAIENPIGIMSGNMPYLKKYYPDLYEKAKDLPSPQYINPWEYGHPETKKTCLWLKNLPYLTPTRNVYEEMMKLPKSQRNRVHYMSPGPKRAEMRSKTYAGWAKAMATRWGAL